MVPLEAHQAEEIPCTFCEMDPFSALLQEESECILLKHLVRVHISETKSLASDLWGYNLTSS